VSSAGSLAGVVAGALALLACAGCAVAAWQPRLGPRARAGAAVAAPVLLLVAAGLAAVAGGAPAPAGPGGSGGPAALARAGPAAGWLLTVVVAAAGGGPLSELVLRVAGRRPPSTDATLQAAIERAGEVLRGGATIGVLERGAVAMTLLAGFPEGLAVVVAVKALGRYPELRAPGASERFIIGTLVSLVWAASAAGVGVALFGRGPA
jgi:hypothetical protein